MRFKTYQQLRWLVPLLLLNGCLSPVRQDVDAVVSDLATHPLDAQPAAEISKPSTSGDKSSPSPAQSVVPKSPASMMPDEQVTPAGASQSSSGQGTPAPTQDEKFVKRLELPPGLPGAGGPFQVPRPGASEAEKQKAYRALFPPLLPLPKHPAPKPSQYGHPLTLAELQQLAMTYNPTLRQLASDVKGAEGAAKQAGAYPNPNFGYESDTAGTAGGAGYQGFYVEQMIKTGGKLKLAEAQAVMDLENARLALRAGQSDVMTQVRTNYFALLVAEQNMLWSAGLAEYTERIYEIYVRQAAVGGLLAGYEPLQLRALADQARITLVQAQTRYLSAWRQLAAAVGLPNWELTEVAGRAEMKVPVFDHDAVLAWIWTNHTDILTARNSQQRARYGLRLAQVTPFSDFDVRVAVQKDYTGPPFDIVHSVQFGMALPVWDQNKGAIQQAQAALLRATDQEHNSRDSLATRLADAFERYTVGQIQVRDYRERILPDLARAYTRTLLRATGPNMPAPAGSPTPALADIVTSQGLYVTAVATYAAALQSQWQAVVDLASLLQTEDLFQLNPCPGPAPDLEHVLPLPCSHPCQLGDNAAASPDTRTQ